MKLEKNAPYLLKVGSIDVLQKQDGTKRNPNSLRFLIGHIINAIFGGNVSNAALQLSQHGGRYRDERSDRGPKRLNEKNITQILRDETFIEYWHIEIFARAIGVPSGIFLLLSRELSYQRYKLQTHNADVFHRCLTEYLTKIPALVADNAGDANRFAQAVLDLGQEAFRPLRAVDQDTKMLF